MWLLAIVVVALLVGAPSASAAPTLEYQCSPAPSDCSGWYRSAVNLSWDWDQLVAAPSAGVCTPKSFTTDTKGTTTFCEVEDTATSQKTRHTLTIHIDRVPPAVTAASSRPPDHRGWFNHPVSIAFTGKDATSGVASCSDVSYAGPEGPGLSVTGSCTDVAGNVGAAAFPLNYDASPPRAPQVQPIPGDKLVRLEWSPPSDATAVEVTRLSPRSKLVYRGGRTRAIDQGLKNGVRYRYRFTAIDRAGNRASAVASATPTDSDLLLPAGRGRLGAPPLLAWKKVKGASYYNVQLFRGSRKILTRWPRSNRLQLRGSWRFAGKRRRLTAETYTWYVFAVFGNGAGQDGRLLGKRTFTITR